MHWAAKRNNRELIQLLINYNADVNARDLNGRSPLFYSVRMGNIEATKILLVNMSNAFAIDNFGIKIQETTVNLEILKLLALGQKVINRSLSFSFNV